MNPSGAVLRRGPPAAPLATALLLALAFPPFHLLVPSFVALVPLGVWLGRLPPDGGGRRAALRGGFLAGLLFHSLLLYWLAVPLVLDAAAAMAAFLAVVLTLSTLLAGAVGGMHQAINRLGWPVWVAVPVFWTAMEWVRAHLGDLSFPWMQLGDSLTGWPRLIGAADVVGSRGLSFWLALVSGLVAEAILRGASGGAAGADRTRRALAGLLVVAAVPLTYSLHRWSSVDPRPAARVGVIQPNIPQRLKRDPASALDTTRSAVARLAGGRLAGEAGGLDAVILPETTFPVVVDGAAAREGTDAPGLERWITRLAGALDAPVLYGAWGSAGRTSARDPTGRRFNSAFLRTPDGRRIGRYDKRRLVPGVETVPFVDAAGLRALPVDPSWARFAGLSRGGGARLLPAGSSRFGVLVCYESIFSELSRRYRQRGADFLVNISNDAWFGRRRPSWIRTSGLWQHPAHLVMRAVENRMGVVRSANTGLSGIVDPLGRFTRRAELFEPAAFAGTVTTTPGPTVYARWGDVVGVSAVLAAAGALLACLLQT